MSNPPLSGSGERSCPYQGLVPYQEQDADYFFGRQNETDIIVANCLTTRVTLLYGASGVGKSSILYAGVAPAIKKRALENLRELNCAECVIVCFGSWRDDPVAGLQQRVDSTLREILPAARAMDAPESKPSLVETLRAWTSVLQSDVVLVLDQFEEHFLYRAVHDNSFGDQLVAVLNDPDLRVNVLISLREDRVAQLDAFKSTIPGLFDNSLRLEHLTEEAARAAIEGPLALFNSRFRADAVPITVEPPLVDAVLDEVRAGRVRVREAGQGELKAVESTRPDSMRVEAPYLQMVMMRMWREEVVPGKTSLTLAAFKRLGGAQEIVRTHLDAVMNKLSAKDRVLAARVFHQLVTPGGTKIAHFVNDLAQYVGGSPGAIQKMFDALDQPESRVLRDVSPPDAPSKRYEIFHDLLAAPVLDWRRREVVAEQQARTRRWLWLACFVLVVAGVVLGWKIVQREKALAEQNDKKLAAQRSEAENRAKADEQKIAKTQELVVAERKSKIEGVDLEKKALESVKNKDEQFTNVPIPMVPGDDDQPPPADSSNALLFETDKLFVHKGSVWTASYGSAQFVAAGKLNSFVITASRDKTAGIWDLKGDKDFFLRGHTGEVNHALFNPSPHSDGTGWLAATASDDNTAAIWRWSDGAKPTFLKGHSGPVSGLAWSRDGNWLVTTSKDQEVRIWNLASNDPAKNPKVLKGHKASVWLPCLVETGNNGWLVTPSNDGTARIWTFPAGEAAGFSNGSLEPGIFRHGSPVRRAVMNSNARWVLTAGGAGHAILWDRASGEKLLTVHHEKPVNDVAFHPSGKLFVTAAADNTAEVWNAETRKGVVTLRGHTAPVFSARFTPNGPGVVTVSWDRTARLWNYETKKCVAILRGHVDVLWSVEFSANGNNFTTTSGDGTARLWDLKSIPGGTAFMPRAGSGK